MSEESAPAPNQGIGTWIVSGSVALVIVIGGAVAFNSADKSAEEGNPTPNQTVAPGGGHTTGPTGDTAASPVTAPTEARGAAGVLGMQLTIPGTNGRGSGDAASRAPGARPTAPPALPVRNRAENLAPEVGRQAAPPRLNGLVLAADGSAPVGLNPDQAAQINETPEAPDQIPATFEPNTETEARGVAPVPSEPGTYSLTWQENGQQFSAHVNVGQDGRVTIFDADGTPDRYHYDPATGRLTATVTPGTGADQHNENDRNAAKRASDQVSADTGSSEITRAESAFPATTAPLATVGSARPPTQVGNSAEQTEPTPAEVRVTPIRATQILTEDTETEQSGVQLTEAEQPRAEVTETKQTQVEATETKPPRAVVIETNQPRVEATETKQPRAVTQTNQPHVQTTRTRPTLSQSRAQPTETAPRSTAPKSRSTGPARTVGPTPALETDRPVSPSGTSRTPC